MNRRTFCAVLALLFCLAAIDDRSHVHAWLTNFAAAQSFDPRPNWTSDERPNRRPRRQRDRQNLVTVDFPVADLVRTSGRSEALFANPLELVESLRRTIRPRDRQREEIEWRDRLQILRITTEQKRIDDIRKHLQRLRGVGLQRVDLTLRLLILPADAVDRPLSSSAALISETERQRIENSFRDGIGSDRNFTHRHSLRDGDIVYGWTTTATHRDETYRGLNVLLDVADDARGVTLTSIPFAGDAERVDWPKLHVSVGQSAVYDVPTTPRDVKSDDRMRVLAFITIDGITPAR